jgi:hypothetical protein
MSDGWVSEVSEGVKSDNWQDRYSAFDKLKENLTSVKKEETLHLLWQLLWKGLNDDNGNVRNHAFYALKHFRMVCIIIESDYELSILQEIYQTARREQNKKIKAGLLRSLLELSCPHLRDIAAEKGLHKEYDEIESYMYEQTEGKYAMEKQKRQENLMFSDTYNQDTFDILRKTGNIFYPEMLDEFEEEISKDSKESIGYNMFVHGIKLGSDLILSLLPDLEREKVLIRLESEVENLDKNS